MVLIYDTYVGVQYAVNIVVTLCRRLRLSTTFRIYSGKQLNKQNFRSS